jgi:hypothetical protein
LFVWNAFQCPRIRASSGEFATLASFLSELYTYLHPGCV